MSLPAKLPPSTISIYGYQSLNGITPQQAGYQFGIIDQMYYGAQNDWVGQSVLFKLSNSLQLKHSGNVYFLIQEENIVLTENVESES